eukprot:1185088-Prymnesium_polylepis.1
MSTSPFADVEGRITNAKMFWLLALPTAQEACQDRGPWPCNEDGCPAPVIDCKRLKSNCDSMFTDVWRAAPSPETAGARIDEHCPVTCGKCQPGAAKPASKPRGESKCVSWRQTNDCSANGKRQSQKDRPCSARIPQGWSGYC